MDGVLTFFLQLESKIKKNAFKSHRDRVEEMNKFLDSLSDVLLVRLSWLMFSIMTCRRLGLDNA